MVDDFTSDRIGLLDTLKTFTEGAVKDLILPTRIQKEGEEPLYRAADVYKMRLPDKDAKSAMKKAPYIIHQLITARDAQPIGERASSSAVVRSIFCVYNGEDSQEGSLMLLNLSERFRIPLLKTLSIGHRYALDLTTQPLELLIYPDDTAPYFLGEMVSNWIIPPIEREVRPWV